MIRKEGDYFFIEGEEKKPRDKPLEPKRKDQQQNKVIEEVGDVKAYLKEISAKIAQIKQVKMKQRQEKKSQGLFDTLTSNSQEKSLAEQKVSFQIKIPDEIYKLDQRLRKIENKINVDEIFRQKIQRKGTMTERVKALHAKVQKLLQKSPEIIYNNIQNYCISLDEKEANMKILYLYDSFSKTQGINEQIQVLQQYLQNLNKIQIKIKGMSSAESIVEDHNGLTAKRAELSARIHKLFKYMKTEYEKIAKQIDEL